jgi:hypothetical protein
MTLHINQGRVDVDLAALVRLPRVRLRARVRPRFPSRAFTHLGLLGDTSAYSLTHTDGKKARLAA